MPRFLTKTDTDYFELILNQLMELHPYPPHYNNLYKAYNSFEPDSNTAATVEDLAKVVSTVDKDAAALIRGTLSVKIRQTNYPSSWDQPSIAARNTYLKNNSSKGMKTSQLWICPGHFPQKPHVDSISTVSIDHVIAVAAHWNAIGYNSDRITRTNWYYDISNHAYLCKPCNSSRGSGGIFFRATTGPNYSN